MRADNLSRELPNTNALLLDGGCDAPLVMYQEDHMSSPVQPTAEETPDCSSADNGDPQESDLPLRTEPCPLFFVHSEDVLFLREYSIPNFNRKVLKSLLDHSSNIHVTFSKLRRETWIQPDQVMKHEHLPVTKPPRAYPDRRNGHGFSYDLSNLLGYHL